MAQALRGTREQLGATTAEKLNKVYAGSRIRFRAAAYQSLKDLVNGAKANPGGVDYELAGRRHWRLTADHVGMLGNDHPSVYRNHVLHAFRCVPDAALDEGSLPVQKYLLVGCCGRSSRYRCHAIGLDVRQRSHIAHTVVALDAAGNFALAGAAVGMTCLGGTITKCSATPLPAPSTRLLRVDLSCVHASIRSSERNPD